MKINPFTPLSLVFFFFAFSSSLFGIDYTPPVMPTREAQQAYLQKVLAENPWLNGTNLYTSMKNLLGAEQKFLQGMIDHPEYQLLNPGRPDLVTIRIQKEAEEMIEVMSLDPASLDLFKKETLSILSNLNQTDNVEIDKTLDQVLIERLRELGKSDPRGILTGLINCLPPDQRKNFYKLNSADKLLEALNSEPALTDQSIQSGFRGGDYGFTDGELTKDNLLQHIRRMIDKEKEVVPLLRAKWFLVHNRTRDGHTLDNLNSVREAIEHSNSDSFDIASDKLKPTAVEDFLAQTRMLIQTGNKAIDGRLSKYLEKTVEEWKNADYIRENKKGLKKVPYLVVQEVPAYIAVHRSMITGDCGTRDDFPFPYSPIEHSFFVFNTQNQVIAYVGTTRLLTGAQVPTFYVHDITGSINQDDRDNVLRVLSHLPGEFQSKLTTVQRNYHYVTTTLPLNDEFQPNIYPDSDLRGYFARNSANAHGDRPQDNQQSKIIDPQPLVGLHYEVIRQTETGATNDGEQIEKTSPSSRLKALLELSLMKDPQYYSSELLGIEVEEQKRLLSAILNTDQLPVADYWERLTEVFRSFDVQLSEKFIKKDPQFFYKGHMRAPDVFAGEDENFLVRTVSLAMWKLRFDDKDGAIYTVIAKFSPSLLNHEKFVHGLGQLDVERVENQARIGNLLAAGLSMKFIAPTMERLRQLSLSQDLRIRTAAYREWVTRFGKESVDGDLAAEIATLLENEKHDSDVYSLEALSLLEDSEGVNDPRVVKNLSRSVKYEENLDIALGAAWILANSTEMSEPLHSLISQRLTSDQNDSPIRQKLLAHPQFKPRRELSCINIFGDPSI